MPEWCDFTCKFAEFPDSTDVVGACRTIQAVFCTKHHCLVPKNGRCADERVANHNKSTRQ